MRIVQLDRVHRRKFAQRTRLFLEASHDIFQRRTNEEVLLLESELLTLRCVIIGVQHVCDVLTLLLVFYGLEVITSVEVFQIKLFGGFRTPQSDV